MYSWGKIVDTQGLLLPISCFIFSGYLGTGLFIYYSLFTIYYLEKANKKIVTKNMDYNIHEMTIDGTKSN